MKMCPLSRRALAHQGSPQGPGDNIEDDMQAQARRTLAPGGGEKRFENPVPDFRGHAVAVIAIVELKGAVGSGHLDADQARLVRSKGMNQGIDNKIGQDWEMAPG